MRFPILIPYTSLLALTLLTFLTLLTPTTALSPQSQHLNPNPTIGLAVQTLPPQQQQLRNPTASPPKPKHRYRYVSRRRDQAVSAGGETQHTEAAWRKLLAAVACAVFVSVW